jgi:hypothetical protein
MKTMDAPNWQKGSSARYRSSLHKLCWHIKILRTITSFCQNRQKCIRSLCTLVTCTRRVLTACRKPNVVAICWTVPELSLNEYSNTAFPSCLPCTTNKLSSQLIHERRWFLSVYSHSSAGEEMLGLIGTRRFIANFFIIKPIRCTNFPNLLRHETRNSYMFRAVPLPIIRSLFTVNSALVCHTGLKTAFEQDSVPSWSCSKAVLKPVWHIPVPSEKWINSRWWAEELPETCRVSCRSKFGKLVYLVGFIIKKFVTMHGHMNVKKFFIANVHKSPPADPIPRQMKLFSILTSHFTKLYFSITFLIRLTLESVIFRIDITHWRWYTRIFTSGACSVSSPSHHHWFNNNGAKWHVRTMTHLTM